MSVRWLLLPVCLIAGCASLRQPGQPERAPPPTQAAADKAYPPEPVDPEKLGQLRTDVIRGLIDKGQYYAALAHVEEQKRGGENSELIYLEAEARRHLGQRPQSEGLYRKLIGSSLEGQAYHGLGLLAAPTDTEAAIRNLRSASQRLPTDVEIRNDLGYALMEAGRYAEALPELSTAAELAPTQIKSRNNLIILMLLTGNQSGLAQLAQQSGTSPETMKQLRDQAQSIRAQQAARNARAPA